MHARKAQNFVRAIAQAEKKELFWLWVFHEQRYDVTYIDGFCKVIGKERNSMEQQHISALHTVPLRPDLTEPS